MKPLATGERYAVSYRAATTRRPLPRRDCTASATALLRTATAAARGYRVLRSLAVDRQAGVPPVDVSFLDCRVHLREEVDREAGGLGRARFAFGAELAGDAVRVHRADGARPQAVQVRERENRRGLQFDVEDAGLLKRRDAFVAAAASKSSNPGRDCPA